MGNLPQLRLRRSWVLSRSLGTRQARVNFFLPSIPPKAPSLSPHWADVNESALMVGFKFAAIFKLGARRPLFAGRRVVTQETIGSTEPARGMYGSRPQAPTALRHGACAALHRAAGPRPERPAGTAARAHMHARKPLPRTHMYCM